MAIVNRDLDTSQRRQVVSVKHMAATLTGGTYIIGFVPSACEVKAIRLSALGLSSVPVFEIEAYTFSGGVTINSAVSTATSVGLWSTSGLISLTLGTAGSTQVQLAAGTALVLTVTGANSAAAEVVGEIVVENLQDIVTAFGV